MVQLTFYHSAICPRCRLASIALNSLLHNYPHIQLERVEFLTHRKDASDAGIRMIPALRAQGRTLSGFLLTKSGIREFLDSLADVPIADTPLSGHGA